MRFKKIFSIVLSFSLMFSGMSFCLAQETDLKGLTGDDCKILQGADDYTSNFFGETFKHLKDLLKNATDCGWSENRKDAKCTLGIYNVTTNDYGKNGDKNYTLNAEWKCTVGPNVCNCSISNYKTKLKAGIFKYSDKNNNLNQYLILDDKLANNDMANYVSKLAGMASGTKKDICADVQAGLKSCEENLETKTNEFENEKNRLESIINEKSDLSFLWWGVPIALVAWLGNLIYKNYKLFTEKKNANAQAQTVYYYPDPNYALYGNTQGTFQQDYQWQDLAVSPQEKKEPKKEDSSEKKDETSKEGKSEKEVSLKDVIKDITNE